MQQFQQAMIALKLSFWLTCTCFYLACVALRYKCPANLKTTIMQSPKALEASQFLPLRAGEVHFSRIPVEYWEHRILTIKALGLNTLSIYIMWNYHEVSKGVFDYETQNKNLPLFLQLAQKHNMFVMFRPGPYVCAEWDFGGLPARLLNVQGIVMRANNKIFLQETKVYFQSLVPILRKYMRTQTNPDAPIIMLQIENEYGFYGTDKSYMEALRQIWRGLEIHITQYYVDWIQNIKKCHWQGANIGINDFSKQEQQDTVRQFQKNGFLLGGEIYSGWMTHWTEQWGGKSTTRVLKDYDFLLSKNLSFAMYVVHGGTNFGLTAGANGLNNKPNDYWGAITSYDYDAPINEQGSVTAKFYEIRKLFSKYIPNLPQIPEPLPMIEIPPFSLNAKVNILNHLPASSVTHTHPLPFQSNELQMYNQGLVLYETKIENRAHLLKIVVHDFALVWLGDKFLTTLDRTKLKTHSLQISQESVQKYGSSLKILVEASGHINFDKNMWTDKKGLDKIEGLGEQQVWTMWKYPLDYEALTSLPEDSPQSHVNEGRRFPKIFTNKIELLYTGDTYFDMSQYGKGYLWVNGRNLGRYWDIGPQKRLFCPGVWLKKGTNEITVLNVYGDAGGLIKGVKQLYDVPVYYDPKKE